MDKAPRTTAQEIGDGVNALISETDRFQDWDSERVLNLRSSIDQLQKADARGAFIRRGQLAAISGNVPEMLEAFRKALQHPDPVTTNHEFWVAMANVGLYDRAHELGTWLLEPRRQFFPRIWERAVAMGQPLAVWERLIDAQRTWPELKSIDFSQLESAVAVMQERKLTDGAICSVLVLAGEVQREHRIMFAGSEVTRLKVMRPPEEPPYLYLAIPLDTTTIEVHAMNRRFTKLLVEKTPNGAFPDGLVVSFAKAPVSELRAAA